MEDRAPYFVNGKDTSPVTRSRLVELLELGRAEMITKKSRHERKRARAKKDRDAQFHQRCMDACQSWIDDAVLVLDALKHGLHADEVIARRVSPPVERLSETLPKDLFNRRNRPE